MFYSRLFGFLRLTEAICENLDVTHKSFLSKVSHIVHQYTQDAIPEYFANMNRDWKQNK